LDNDKYEMFYYDVTSKEDYWAKAFFAVKDKSITFLAYTDYGVYGHIWNNIGDGAWDAFLRKLGRDYLHAKFRGQNSGYERSVFLEKVWPEIMKRVGVPF
jgi:hypothetical protein